MAKQCALACEASLRLLSRRAQTLRKRAEEAHSHDMEAIHDLRVASRRLRAALREHRAYTDSADAVIELAREITRALGKARELDVTIDLLAKRRRKLDAARRPALNATLRGLRALRAKENPEVDRAIGVALGHELEHALAACFEDIAPTRRCYLRRAAQRLHRQYTASAQVYRLWLTFPGEEVLHRLRVCFKKLRYAAELYAPLYSDALAPFLALLKRQQTILGAWNDLRVARNYTAGQDLFDAELAELLGTFRAAAAEFFSTENSQTLQAMFDAVSTVCCRESGLDSGELDALYERA